MAVAHAGLRAASVVQCLGTFHNGFDVLHGLESDLSIPLFVQKQAGNTLAN
ncbi:hypothetical protein D3C87_2091060 [compost metagenome]